MNNVIREIIINKYNIMSETIEFTMKLGDVVQVWAPTNSNIHNKIYYIDYIDNDIILCINLNDGTKTTFDLDANGCLTDTTIVQITLLSRSPKDGYAAQHELVAGKYVKMIFDFIKPLTIHGKIIETVEDMIQIQTSDDQVIFIDFEYKGIPRNIPLTHISIVEPLSVLEKSELKDKQRDHVEQMEEGKEEASMEYSPEGNLLVKVPPNPKMDSFNFEDSYSSLQLGEEIEFEAVVEVNRAEQRYGIEMQTNDLLDELLSTIPDEARTSVVMEKIHRTIRRFKELRELFSTFDEHGNVTGYNNFNALYKPLVKQLASLNTNLKWIVPVVKQETKINNNAKLIEDLEDYTSVLDRDNINNYYVTQNKSANYFFTPFQEDSTAQPIKTDLEAILDDLGNFETKVDRGIAKYVFQRYNMGMTKLGKTTLRSGKVVNVREPYTNNDGVQIKSVVILPKPIMEFSRVQLPGTDILQRTVLSHNWMYYYKLLQRKTVIENKDVRSGTEINYIEQDEDIHKTFGDSAYTYTIPNNTSYEEALQSIIPRTVTLIRELKSNYIGYNFHSMLAYFEPFLLNINNITYSGRAKNEQTDNKGGPYQELRVHIRDNVKKYIEKLVDQRKLFAKLLDVKSLKSAPNPLLNHIINDFLAKVTKEYKLSETMTPSEILCKINAIDNGAFYYSVMTYIISYLYTPELAHLRLTSESYKSSESCNTRVIAKKYTSFKDLQKDNGNEEVYFDKDYDSTPYDILKKYSTSQQRMSNSEFIDYFALVLQKEHGVTGNATELAKTIVAKKKPVVEGNYAVLIIYPKSKYAENTNAENTDIEADIKKRITYFVRKGDNWVQETNMSETELTNELMCNTNNKCFFDKNQEFCDTIENATKRVKHTTRQNMIGTSIALSLEDFRKQIINNYKIEEHAIKKTRAIKEAKAEQYSQMAYTIGTRAVFNEIVVSPYASILNSIIDMVDFTKRQEYIIRFKNDYCREPVVNDLVNESIHWFYCKDTNVKLMPNYLFMLAQAFFNGQYEKTLDHICSTRGKKSDDGEAIVDKYSGYVIRYLNFSAEEDYDDQGFKVITHAVMDDNELNIDTIMHEAHLTHTKGSKRTFDNPLHQQIYNVAKAIVERLHIDFVEIENSIMIHAVRVVSNTLYNEQTYKNKTANSQNAPPYEKYQNQHVFFITASCTFIVIQSQIPSLRSKKTFPGCVYSLRGYPLEQTGDQTGLKYLACVLDKMRNIGAQPWISVSKIKPDVLQKKLFEMTDQMVLLDQQILKMLELKRTHMLLEPDTYIPDEHNVSKWLHFQPPLIKPHIEKTVNGVGDELLKQAVDTIKSGNSSQHDHLGTIYNKMIEHTIATFDNINTIVGVDSENLALKPNHFENACCESNSLIKCIDYFANKDENIRKNINFIQKYETIYNDIKLLTVAPYLTSKTAKTIVIGEDHGISTQNMYEAYIHYCKLRSDLPIPDDLKTICQEKLPGLSAMSIEQAIEALNDHGKKQNMNTLMNLMTTIANRNRVVIQTNNMPEPEFYGAFENDALGKGIRKIIDELESPSQNGFQFNTVLINSNKKMIDAIKDFLEKYANLGKDLDKMIKYLDTVSTWSDPLKVHSFLFDSIKNIVNVVPNIIKHKVKSNRKKLKTTMKHWELAPRHYEILSEFIKTYYEDLNSFSNKQTLFNLMTDIHDDLNMKDIIILMDKLPKMTLKEDTLMYVYKFCYLSVFFEILLFSHNLHAYNNFEEEEKEVEDIEYNLREVEISDKRTVFYKHTAKLMATLINIDMTNKKTLNFNYKELMDSSRKDALVEKKKITDRLKNMGEARSSELILKKYKLGVWNLGMQKGIYEYDKALYDQEVTDLQPQPNMTVADMDQLEQEQHNAQEELEAYDDIGMDGDYYPEDRDDEFRD